MALALERELDWEELDSFLLTAPAAHFYHCSTWLRSLETVCGHRLGCLTWREGGELRAILPFADSQKLGLRHRQSLPFGTYGGPVLAAACETRIAGLLVDAFWRELGGLVQRATLVSPPELGGFDRDPDEAPLIDAPAPEPGERSLSTQILDLRPGWETLFSQVLRKERRRQIRKALKSGLEVQRSQDAGELKSYYAVYLEHVRDWGLKTPTALEHLLHLLKDRERVRFWTLRHEGRIIGGHFNFHFKGAVTAWNGTVSKAHRHLSPSVLLYAVNLERACAEGESWFNFGGSEGNEALSQFKAAFGAETLSYGVRRRHAAPLSWLAARAERRA